MWGVAVRPSYVLNARFLKVYYDINSYQFE